MGSINQAPDKAWLPSCQIHNLRRLICQCVLMMTVALHTGLTQASPWVAPGDYLLRQDLQLLNDSGVVNLPLTTWPLLWSDVRYQVQGVDPKNLSAAQRRALKHVQFEMGYQTGRGLRKAVKLAVANQSQMLRGFSDVTRESGEVNATLDWQGEQFSWGLSGSYHADPQDDKNARLDGSYFSGVLGDWIVGVGAIDRWWGPGWQSSLILSNNARPIPALMFRRKHSLASESSWLSWMGQWQFVSFLGQLESGRHIPKAKLLGMRFVMKPLSSLELGASRASQWGGDGRSEGLSDLFDSITARGENSLDGAGNQLGGFDARYSFSLGSSAGAVYAQGTGEDEAGFLPSKYIFLAGVELNAYKSESGDGIHLTLETMDSASGALYGDVDLNTAYEHSIYKTGYRYRGRPLGATLDNDGRAVGFGSNFLKASGEVYRVLFSYVELNRDDVAAGNQVATKSQDLLGLKFGYENMLFGGKLNASVQIWNQEIQSSIVDVDRATLALGWEYRL